MILDLYAVISNFAANLAHNFLGSIFRWLFFFRRLRLYSLSSDESESLNNESDESCFLFLQFFSLYHISFCLIYCNWYHSNNQIRLMMSLTMMGLTPVPLVRMLFSFSLWLICWSYCRFCWLCKLRGIWCFGPDSNRFNWWRCSIGCVFTKRSGLQRHLTHRIFLTPKILIFLPSFNISFVAIVLFWPRPARSCRCNFSKNMIWSRPVEPIRQPSNSSSGVNKGPEFIRWVDIQEPQMHKIWCLGSYGITHEFHPTARVDIGTGTVGQFSYYYLAGNGRKIPIICPSFHQLKCWTFGYPRFPQNQWTHVYWEYTGYPWYHRLRRWWYIQLELACFDRGGLHNVECSLKWCHFFPSWLHAQDSGERVRCFSPHLWWLPS